MTRLRILDAGARAQPRPPPTFPCRSEGRARRFRSRPRRARSPGSVSRAARCSCSRSPGAERGSATALGSQPRTGCATPTCCGSRGTEIRGPACTATSWPERRRAGEPNPTEPPVVLVPPPRGEGRGAAHEDLAITPIPYSPAAAVLRLRRRRARVPRLAASSSSCWRCVGAALLRALAPGARRAARRSRARSSRAARRLARAALAVPASSPSSAATRSRPRRRATGGSRRRSTWSAGAVLRYSLRPLPGTARGRHARTGRAPRWRSTGRCGGTTPLAAFEVEPGERALARARVGLRGAPRDGRGRGPRDAAVARRHARAASHATAGAAASAAAGTARAVVRSAGRARQPRRGATAAMTPLELPLEPGRPHTLRLTKPGPRRRRARRSRCARASGARRRCGSHRSSAR